MLQHIREISLARMAGGGVIVFEFFRVHKGTVVFGFLHGNNKVSWRLARGWCFFEGSRENEELKFRGGTMGIESIGEFLGHLQSWTSKDGRTGYGRLASGDLARCCVGTLLHVRNENNHMVHHFEENQCNKDCVPSPSWHFLAYLIDTGLLVKFTLNVTRNGTVESALALMA